MTGPTSPQRCREHRLTLTPDGICPECRRRDLVTAAKELAADLRLIGDRLAFDQIVAQLRAEDDDGLFAPMPDVPPRRLKTIGDLSGYPTLDGGQLDRRPKEES